MKINIPPKVDDYTEFWVAAPPERSPRCVYWVNKLRAGWVPNRRIQLMNYDEASQFYGIYIWEYLYIIFPMAHVKELVAGKTYDIREKILGGI